MKEPSHHIRAFFAIDLPENIISNIITIQEKFKKEMPQIIKWVNPSQQHITLKFIGALKAQDIYPLQTAIQKEIKSLPSFKLNVVNIGAFPNINRPKIVWVGITDYQEVIKLFEIIESNTSRLGYKKETHSFSPHITLGRIKPIASKNELLSISQTIEDMNHYQFGELRVTKVVLYKSTLTPKGPIYDLLFSETLANKSA